MKQDYYQYWGKAAVNGSYHLLVYHCLDVAAVGFQLLKQSPDLLARLSALCGSDEGETLPWLVYFLVLHDLGKFADSFQNLRPDLLSDLQHRRSDRAYAKKHDSLGFLLWQRRIKPVLSSRGCFEMAHGRRLSDAEVCADFLARAVTGHHGEPPENIQNISDTLVFELSQDFNAAENFCLSVLKILDLEEKVLPFTHSEQMKNASWWISGFTVLCDWLGSSRDSYQYVKKIMPLAEYWENALGWAAVKIKENNMLYKPVNRHLELRELFGLHIKGDVELTPLQKIAAEINIDAGSQLFILEDVTGAGKTEAALILLYRLMQQQKASGFYFALPTMATANAMYSRLAEVYRKFYGLDEMPSLVLGHGASRLNALYLGSIQKPEGMEFIENGDETLSAAAHCSLWLSDNSKKTFLGDAGVGTIDQALLSVLPSKHQSLRLFGLLGKVILVDEVHACDVYMLNLLCGVIESQIRCGGHVILLSATLPEKQREMLIKAYYRGLDIPAAQLKSTALDDYPLLTHAQTDGVDEINVATRNSVRRSIKVNLVSDKEKLLTGIYQALDSGHCVCWIRNTVADVLDVYREIKQKRPQAPVTVFHSRYAIADRLKIEQIVLDRFGPESDSHKRQGQLLLATQVVEQSLDLDFDLMLTDLAPVDLIVQRAGRLRRHSRDVVGNRIEGEDQRGMAELMVFTPQWDDAPQQDWLKSALPGTAAVYEFQDGQLWLTAKLLRAKGGFTMPEDARYLIEGVYSEASLMDIPDGLSALSNEQSGKHSAQTSLANSSQLKMSMGYQKEFQSFWWDEMVARTRLGDETVKVYLARFLHNSLRPWSDVQEHAWENSTLNIRKGKLADDWLTDGVPGKEIEWVKGCLPAAGKYCILLILKETDGVWFGRLQGKDGEVYTAQYSEELGLTIEYT